MRYSAVVKGGLHPGYSSNLDGIKLSWNDANSTRAVQALSKKGSFPLREMIDSMVSNTNLGANVRFRMNQISASPEMGGKRAIDDVFLIDRPSTAIDQAMVLLAVTEQTELTHSVDQIANGDRNPLGTR